MADRSKKFWSYGTYSGVLSTGVVAEKGKLACLNTANGKITKGYVSTTIVPIGYFLESKTGDDVEEIEVQLFKEIFVHQWDNSSGDPVAATQIGSDCYIEDDTTVSGTDGGSTQSAAGRVWGVTSTHVLVQMVGF